MIMKAKEFTGIIPPVLTAFTEQGEIYEKGIREIVSFVLPHVDGLYPVGTYGCGPMMTVPERKRALEIVLDEVNGKVPVVAHVGAADTVSKQLAHFDQHFISLPVPVPIVDLLEVVHIGHNY